MIESAKKSMVVYRLLSCVITYKPKVVIKGILLTNSYFHEHYVRMEREEKDTYLSTLLEELGKEKEWVIGEFA
jgi:hypothetical protein